MTSGSIHNEAVPSEVGWQFVRQYYEYANKQPHLLHRFYGKPSTFSHCAEGESDEPVYGLQEIHHRITTIGFEDCKVLIQSVDAQPSADDGIILQVIGEMSNRGEACRKFVQTIFLAKQSTGYFVLNDIFRFLDISGIEGREDDEETPANEGPATPPHSTPAPVLRPPQKSISEPAEASPVPNPQPDDAPVAAKHEATPTEKPLAPGSTTLTLTPHSTSTFEFMTASVLKPSPPSVPPIQQAWSYARSPQQQRTPQPKTQVNVDAAKLKFGSPTSNESKGVPDIQATTTSTDAPASPALAHGHGQHPAYVAAQNITHPQCFVKRVLESVTEQALNQVLASRFGPFKNLEVVRSKACAFLEFENLESAKRAITASLPPIQGGEGGIMIDSESGGHTRIFIETRRPRSDRLANRPGRGTGQGNDGRGGYRGRGQGVPRGRGGPRT